MRCCLLLLLLQAVEMNFHLSSASSTACPRTAQQMRLMLAGLTDCGERSALVRSETSKRLDHARARSRLFVDLKFKKYQKHFHRWVVRDEQKIPGALIIS